MFERSGFDRVVILVISFFSHDDFHLECLEKRGSAMKRVGSFYIVAALMMIFSLNAIAGVAVIDFSPGGDDPGNWSYVGSSSTGGTFSFDQQVDIDAVGGDSIDALFDQFVYIPELTLVNYVSSSFGVGSGTVTSSSVIQIKDSTGNVLLEGTLSDGTFAAFYTTSVIYPEMALDIVVTSVNNTVGSDILSLISVGDNLDFNLTLQWSSLFDSMITTSGTGSNGFSGSMIFNSELVPEPATLILLSIGGVLIRKR